MSFKILRGPLLNHLTRSFVAPVMDPVALTGFGVEFLRDMRSSLPAFFSIAQENSTITMDLNLLPIAASGWTPYITGDVSGSGTLTLAPLDVDMLAIYDVTVRQGEILHFKATVTATTADDAHVFVRNRIDGTWLQNDGSWETADDYTTATPFATSSGSPDAQTTDFTVAALADLREDTVPLRIYLVTYGGEAEFEDVLMWPHSNWISIHGHNIPAHIIPLLEKSDDGSSWTELIDPMVPLRDSFYHAFAVDDTRYLRLFLSGVPDTGCKMYFGEIVVGYYGELIRNPRYGGSINWNERQLRLQSALGDQFVHLHGSRPQRTFAFETVTDTDAQYRENRDLLFRASRGGYNPVVIAPEEMDSTQVILGRIRESMTIAKTDPSPGGSGVRATEWEVEESPLPASTELVPVYDAPIDEDIDV